MTKFKTEIFGDQTVTLKLIYGLNSLGGLILISETIVKVEPIIDIFF